MNIDLYKISVNKQTGLAQYFADYGVYVFEKAG